MWSGFRIEGSEVPRGGVMLKGFRVLRSIMSAVLRIMRVGYQDSYDVWVSRPKQCGLNQA